MNVALLSVNLSRARRGSFAKCVGMSERFLLNQLKKRKSGVFFCKNLSERLSERILIFKEKLFLLVRTLVGTKAKTFRQKNSCSDKKIAMSERFFIIDT